MTAPRSRAAGRAPAEPQGRGGPPNRSAAAAADALTAGRLALAPVLVLAAASSRLTLAAAVLSASWLSDAVDGELARRARSPTRLGDYDLLVDTAVGAALVAGLAAGGRLPALPAAALLLVLGGGYVLLRNPLLSLALQAVGYAALVVTLWSEGAPARWLPIATAALLLVVHRRRLLRVTIPAFLEGVAALPRLERRERFRLVGREDERHDAGSRRARSQRVAATRARGRRSA